MRRLVGSLVITAPLLAGACAMQERSMVGPAQEQALAASGGNIYTVAGYNDFLQGDWVSAERNLLTALQQNPNDPAALLSLGALYERAGRLDLANQYYQRAASVGDRLYPTAVTDPRMLGMTYAQIAESNLQNMRRQ